MLRTATDVQLFGERGGRDEIRLELPARPEPRLGAQANNSVTVPSGVSVVTLHGIRC
jgi:hypothetical protein